MIRSVTRNPESVRLFFLCESSLAQRSKISSEPFLPHCSRKLSGTELYPESVHSSSRIPCRSSTRTSTCLSFFQPPPRCVPSRAWFTAACRPSPYSAASLPVGNVSPCDITSQNAQTKTDCSPHFITIGNLSAVWLPRYEQVSWPIFHDSLCLKVTHVPISEYCTFKSGPRI